MFSGRVKAVVFTTHEAALRFTRREENLDSIIVECLLDSATGKLISEKQV